MTREEAIRALTIERASHSEGGIVEAALDMAISALRYGGPKYVLLSTPPADAQTIDTGIAALREQEERSKGCEFCQKFDFETVAPEIDKYGARLLLATSDCVFPNNRQFKVCPMCGRRLEEV